MKKSLLFIGSIMLPCYLSAQTILSNDSNPLQKDTAALSSEDKNLVHPGLPGVGMSNRLMGTSVLNLGSNPLVVVNGVPWQNVSAQGFDFTTADERDYASLIGIPVDEIEDIAVTTDAFTTAQYGVRAANGVILISTRRGTTGAPKISFKTEGSVQYQPKGYEVLNGDEYIMLMREEFHNAYGFYDLSSPAYRPIAYDRTYKDFYNYSQNTDWLKAITRVGNESNYYLAVSGGIKNLDYRISAGVRNLKETTLGNGESRFTPRLALDYRFSDKLKVSLDLSYTNCSKDQNLQYGSMSVQELALKKMPSMSIYEMDSVGNKTSNYFTPATNFQGSNDMYYNPVAMVKLVKNNLKTNQITPVFRVDYKPFKVLEYNLNLLYDANNRITETFIPTNVYTNYLTDWHSNYSGKGKYEINTFQTQNQLTFQPVLGDKHHLTAKASLLTYSKTTHDSYFDNILPAMINGVFVVGGGYLVDTKFNYYSYSFGVNYTFLNKYILNILGIRDNYSVNHPVKTISPAVHIQWNIIRERFMRSLSFINDLNLNASYSEFGDKRATFIYNIDYATAFYIQKDLSVNLSMFNKRINLRMNVYNRCINDGRVLYIDDNGFYMYYSPILDQENKGWEINLNVGLLKTKDFSVDFSIDLYKNQNIITDYSSSEPKIKGNPMNVGSFVRTFELNKPIGTIKGFHSLGVYSTDQDVIARDRNGNTILNGGTPVNMHTSNYTFQAGDARYADQNYDGVIDASDLVSLGNSNPILTGSFGPGFRYKSWWLGFYFNFRLHNKIINMARLELENLSNKDNKSSAVLNRWRTQGQITDIPRAMYGSQVNSLGSDRFVEDGSFLRLKAITLKYQLPLEYAKKLGLSNLSAYITGRNLFTFTHYKGADPDIWLNNDWQSQGTDNNYMPAIKEVILGISLGL